MASSIQEISVAGFRSIQRLENFKLRNLNVLVGANGAGKSNFIELFKLLREMADQTLQTYVAKAGGGDSLFFGGPKASPHLNACFSFGHNKYKFSLEPTADGRVVLTDEAVLYTGGQYQTQWKTIASGVSESVLKAKKDDSGVIGSKGVPHYVYDSVSKWTVYHFHDTSPLAPMRREQSAEDVSYLRPDAGNIAPFLRRLRDTAPSTYAAIRDTVRIVAPFFDDFLLKDRLVGSDRRIALDWVQKGNDFPFQPWQLSDGTIRFICLAAALLQPAPPPTVVVDEPELGLHPHALEILATLFQKFAQYRQVIVSTQSAPLLSLFAPEDVVVVSRRDGASTFARLNKDSLADWLNDYTLGELWQKNVVEAGVTSD